MGTVDRAMTNSTYEATIWLDTSVALEIDTQGDLYRELDLAEAGALHARVEYRRMRAQGSWWMAMAFCTRRVTTVQYEHESLRNMLMRMAPPGTERGQWAATIAWVFEPGGMFDGWRRSADKDGAGLGDRARDRLMVDKCREHNLSLVTRDKGIPMERARAVGVVAVDPETYAAAVLTREIAREMFLERLDAAAIAWVVAEPSRGLYLERRVDSMLVILRMYRWIWESGNASSSLVSSTGMGAQATGEPMFHRVPGRL